MLAVANAEVIKRLVILIADSKVYSRTLLRSMLLQLEIRKIHEATDGAAALDAINLVNPDVIILDWDLPVVSAREMLPIVRSPGMNSNPDLPIIVISSSGRSAYVHKAIQLGAPHFLVWPISLKTLERRLFGIVTKARKSALANKRRNPALTRGSATALASPQ